jgi:hypothetical protein
MQTTELVHAHAHCLGVQQAAACHTQYDDTIGRWTVPNFNSPYTAAPSTACPAAGSYRCTTQTLCVVTVAACSSILCRWRSLHGQSAEHCSVVPSQTAQAAQQFTLHPSAVDSAGVPTVAAKNHPDIKMHALQWLGKKNVGVKEMPKPCLTDKVRTAHHLGADQCGLACHTHTGTASATGTTVLSQHMLLLCRPAMPCALCRFTALLHLLLASDVVQLSRLCGCCWWRPSLTPAPQHQ